MRKKSTKIVAKYGAIAALTAGSVYGSGASQAEHAKLQIDNSNPFTSVVEKAAKQIINLAQLGQDTIQAPVYPNYFSTFFTDLDRKGGGIMYEVQTAKSYYSSTQVREIDIEQSGPNQYNFYLTILIGKHGTWSAFCDDNPNRNQTNRYSSGEINESTLEVNNTTIGSSRARADSWLNKQLANVDKLVQEAEKYQTSQYTDYLAPLPDNICKIKLR